jgi:hypothetical protein
VKGYKKVDIPTNKLHCEGCLKGEMKAKPFKHSFKRATSPYEMIHMDVMYVPATSYHKYEYIVVIVDDFSSYTCIGLIKNKRQNSYLF